MANSTSVQVILDGPRNTIVKVEGTLDASDLSYAAVIDPAALSDMVPGVKASTFRIRRLWFEIEGGFSAVLYWDATTPRRIAELTGTDSKDYSWFGGLLNNAGADDGYTGKIGLATKGWSNLKSYNLVLELVKCQ